MCAPSEGPIPEDEFATRFAQAICAQKEACGCEVDFICVSTFKLQFELVQQYAADNALHYDAACAGEVLAATVEQRGCKLVSAWWDDWNCWSGCSVFRGDVPSGGACSSTGSDNAAYSNQCAVEDEYCQVLDTLTCEMFDYPTVGLGEECYSPDYDIVGLCEEAAACNFESRVCVPLVGEGDACGDFANCGQGLWCDPQGACLPRKPDGAACEGNVECMSLECLDGSCNDFVVICRVDSPSDLLFSHTL